MAFSTQVLFFHLQQSKMMVLQCHSYFPISHNFSASSQIKPQIAPIFISSRLSSNSITKHLLESRNHSIICRSSQIKNSAFFDENGAVEGMDAYLNYISPEYDTKPSWCQPWTITLTGIGIISCSWLILNSVIVTPLVTTLICAWWYIFLYSYPKAYTNMIAEQRQKVTSGMEDTYGTKTGQ